MLNQVDTAESLVWLHLSDLHSYSVKTGWDARKVLKPLLTDLKEMEEMHGLRPSFIFFTGDAAFGQVGDQKGQRLVDQFEEAQVFLEGVRTLYSPAISIDNVFLVAGNHDVDRTQIMESQTQFLDRQQSDEAIIEHIRSKNLEWKRYMDRLAAYKQFINEGGYAHILSDPDRLIYAVARDIAGIKVGIYGLNSAWSSGRDHERGKLWSAGRFQIGHLKSELSDVNIAIALVHHPWSWLSEYEEPRLSIETENEFHFHLHGHEHLGWVDQKDRGLVRIAAGASYDRSNRDNGYNIVRIDLHTGDAEVWLRKYNSTGGGWVAHILAGKRTDNLGRWILKPLSLKRPRNSTPDLDSPRQEQRREKVTASSIGILWNVPPLPRHFIPRPDVAGGVKKLLLSSSRSYPGILVIGAIQGQGGIGKTVLAQSLAHDSKVRAHFPDGVYWIALGQEPDILLVLTELVQAFDPAFRSTTVGIASRYLHTMLQDKSALLILDDAWETKHLKPFFGDEPNCRFLVTTRRMYVAEDVGAQTCPLDVINPDKSLRLLSKRLERPLKDGEPEAALHLARTVGYLPLALELAAARVRSGIAWSRLIEDLEQEIARLETLEGSRRLLQDQPSLEASLLLSLRALEVKYPKARMLFALLGVLPEDVLVAGSMMATIWQMDNRDASDHLELLWKESLLLQGQPIPVGDTVEHAYRIHDLFHDMARRLLVTEPPHGLGTALAIAHTELLQRFHSKCQRMHSTAIGWSELPDDGYIHSHLTWHMERAGQREQIYDLLSEETLDGKNAWYAARERMGQASGYVQDANRALRLAEETSRDRVQRGEVISTLSIELRTALAIASLNSLAANIPLELLRALVHYDFWKPAIALAYAQRIPDPEASRRALTALIPYLPANMLQDVIAAGREIEEPASRARTLLEMSELLPSKLAPEVRRTALAAIKEIQDPIVRAQLLIAIAQHPPERVRKQVLSDAILATKDIADRSVRARILADIASIARSELAERLSEEAIAHASLLSDAATRARVLSEIASQLPTPFTQRALIKEYESISSIKDTALRARTLVDNSRRLAESGEVSRALMAARKIGDVRLRSNALLQLAPFLKQSESEAALTEAYRIHKPAFREEVMAGIALSFAKNGLWEEALAATRAVHVSKRTGVLVDVLPHVPRSLRTGVLLEVISRLGTIKVSLTRAILCARVLEILPSPTPPAAHDLIAEALEGTRNIQDLSKRANLLLEAAPKASRNLQTDILLEAVRTARDIDDGIASINYQSEAIIALARHNSGKQALAAATEIEDSPSRTKVLKQLIEYLPYDLRAEASEHLGQRPGRVNSKVGGQTYIGRHDDLFHTYGWIRSGQSLIGEANSSVLSEIAQISEPSLRTLLLLDLSAKFVKERNTDRALGAASRIPSARSLARAMVWISSQLSPTEQIQVLRKALALAQERSDDRETQDEVIAEVGAHLVKAHLNDAVAITFRNGNALELFELSSLLDEQIRTEALSRAIQFAERSLKADYRIGFLLKIAQRSSEAMRLDALSKAFAATKQLSDAKTRAYKLLDIARLSQDSLRIDAVRLALDACQEMPEASDRAQFLLQAMPETPEQLRSEALSNAVAASEEIGDGLVHSPAIGDLPLHVASLGFTDEAKGLIDITRSASLRVRALTEIAAYFPESQRVQLLRQALENAQTNPEESERQLLITMIAKALALAGDIDQVVNVLDEINSPEVRASIEAIVALPTANQPIRNAVSALQDIREQSCRDQLLESATQLLANQERSDLALELAREIHSTESRVRALSQIAASIPEPSRTAIFREALSTTRQLVDPAIRAETFIWMMRLLPDELRDEAFNSALSSFAEIAAPSARDKRLFLGVSKLTDLGKSRYATKMAAGINNPATRARVLMNAALTMPERLRNEARAEAVVAIREIKKAESRIRLVIEFAQDLSERLRADALSDALTTVVSINDSAKQEELLPAIVKELALVGQLDSVLRHTHNLPDCQMQMIRAAVKAISELKHGSSRQIRASIREIENQRIAQSILPYVAVRMAKKRMQREALSLASEIEDDVDRVYTLLEISPSDALPAARKIGDAIKRTRAVADIARRVPASEREQAYSAFLADIGSIDDTSVRLKLFMSVIQHVPLTIMSDFLRTVRGIKDVTDRVSALGAIAARLPQVRQTGDRVLAREAALKQELDAALDIATATDRARFYIGVSGLLSDELRAEAFENALAAIHEIAETAERSELCCLLAPLLKERRHLERLYELASQAKDVTRRICPIIAIVPNLRDAQIREAIKTLRAKANSTDAIRTLAKTAQYLPDAFRKEVENSSVNLAKALPGISDRTHALVEIAPDMFQSPQQPQLVAVLKIKEQSARDNLLGDIVSGLVAHSKLDHAENLARRIEGIPARSRALASIVPAVASMGRVDQALSMIDQLNTPQDRSTALAGVIRYLWNESPTAAYSAWHEVIRFITSQTRQQASALLPALTSAVIEHQGRDGGAPLIDAVQQIARWWP